MTDELFEALKLLAKYFECDVEDIPLALEYGFAFFGEDTESALAAQLLEELKQE